MNVKRYRPRDPSLCRLIGVNVRHAPKPYKTYEAQIAAPKVEIMRHFLILLRDKLFDSRRKKKSAAPRPEELHVVVPEAVDLLLPKKPTEQISVPASINGRDRSTGRF